MRDRALLFGVWASLIFAAGVILLPFFVLGYDPLQQTVSEIGEEGSPMRWPFAVMLWLVAGCVIVFAGAVWRASHRGVFGAAATLCIAWMALAAAGIGVFAHPHDLHNLFGISQLIAYQAPLFLALAFRRHRHAQAAVAFSWVMYAVVLASVALNLASLSREGALWDAVGPIFGLVQRSLFASFFVWTAGAGWLLWRAVRPDAASDSLPAS